MERRSGGGLPRRFVERVEEEQRARTVRRVGETGSGEAPEDSGCFLPWGWTGSGVRG